MAGNDARRGGAADTGRSCATRYRLGYEEMLAAGYTAVGEFHYLGFVEALAAAEAAAAAGIELVLLHVAYARGGLPRFRQESVAEFIEQVEGLRDAGPRVGVAPHSVRACPADWLEEIGGTPPSTSSPLHVHADEQPKEIEECLAEHGCRPIELLARTGCLTERTTVVHATHADGARARPPRLVWRSHLCVPDDRGGPRRRLPPAERIRNRGIRLCIGSDSNVRIDPFEELRELEGIARRQSRSPRRVLDRRAVRVRP